MSDLLSKLTSLRRYVDADEVRCGGGSVLIDEQSPDGQYLYYEDAKSLVEAEIARLRITDAEREAVTEMAEVCDSRERRSMEFQLPEEAEYWRGRANILRGLLAKHKGGEL